jgi:hypothetical protein
VPVPQEMAAPATKSSNEEAKSGTTPAKQGDGVHGAAKRNLNSA